MDECIDQIMEEPKIPENQDIQENVIKSPENPVKPRPTKRNFGGGYHFCIVPNCGQTVSNGVSMYTFPNKTKATLLHKSWINILKLKQKPGISAVVCSLHFSEDSFKPRTAKTSRVLLRKGVVPNQNLPDYEDPVKKEKRLKREARYFQRNVLMEAKRVELEAERSAPLVKTEPYDFINCGPVVKEEPPDSPDIEEEPPDSPDIVKEELSTIYQISDDQVSKCDQNNSSVIARQQLKISWDSHVKQEGLGLLFFGSDWKLNFYTGLHALTLLDSIEKAIKNLDQFKNPPREISLRNRIILVFMRMKTDLSFTQLAKVFAVADERVAEYFFETVRFLRAALDFAVRWPIVENNTDQPYHFFPKYVETFVKLDCPSDHLKYFKCQNCRILLHSKHNGELTAKYLIGVAASGLICYCGDGHFVQASDNHVYNAEKVRRHISFGLTVRADKDFFMDDSLRANYSQLCRPPFLVKKKIKSSEVNVEKAIKRFNIFNNSFRKYLVGVMDDLIFIACAVSNLNRM